MTVVDVHATGEPGSSIADHNFPVRAEIHESRTHARSEARHFNTGIAQRLQIGTKSRCSKSVQQQPDLHAGFRTLDQRGANAFRDDAVVEDVVLEVHMVRRGRDRVDDRVVCLAAQIKQPYVGGGQRR